MTFSVKSSVGKLQSFNKALVSTSTSPIGPSSSTRVPKGCKELIGYKENVQHHVSDPGHGEMKRIRT